jgi:nucleotide-binding universal stress UspA family protein
MGMVGEDHADATLLLTALAAEATAGWPGLTVATEVAAGTPAAVLRAAADGADLLVIGADDSSPFMAVISGSATC